MTMTLVTFTGNFDNGHDFYQVDAPVEVDTSKEKLTDVEIVAIVEELQKADRRLHGRSYRGRVTTIQISNEEWDKQQDNGNITLKFGDSEYTFAEGFEWVSTFFADNKAIEAALNAEL